MKLKVKSSAIDKKEVIFATTGGKEFNPELPAIIFLHCAGADHSIWYLQTRYFAYHGYSILAVDFPGHGRSEGECITSIEEMAEWIPELVIAAGLEKASLVGHSMGALVALECASRFSEIISSVCLIGSAAKMPVHPLLLDKSLKGDQLAYDLVTSWEHGPTGHFGNPPVPGMSLLGGAQSLLNSAPKGALGFDLAACNNYQNGMNAASKIRCPVLCLSGSKDKMSPSFEGMKLAEAIPDAKFHIIEDCGHMIMLEKADECLGMLKDHFKSTIK
jgi:pimeloyl-ACP methyl ester carboxylesterase